MNRETTPTADRGTANTGADHGEVLLRVENLVKYFPVQSGQLIRSKRDFVHAVDDVSLEIRQGQTLGLVGETGCGKSTLARCIARLHHLSEPVSALHVSIQAQILNLLAALQSDLGLTYLFIAHDLSVVRHVSNTVAVMYLGKVTEQSPVEQLWAPPRHPYTDALLSAVPIPDPEFAGRRERIILVGDVPSPINPPSGCPFHPRFPKARQACVEEVPDLTPRLGDEPAHVAACLFPVEDGEDLSKSPPTPPPHTPAINPRP